MSKILLVEPRNILRQALSLALFADHEVHLASGLPDRDAAGALGCDLVIIDAAALRETGHAKSDLVATVQGWKVPTLWIDDPEGNQGSARADLVVLARPIRKDALQQAIAECLQMVSIQANRAPSLGVKGEQAAKEETTTAMAQHSQVIELVDVVAEAPESRKSKKR
jgi:hypothetical protein